MVSTSSEGGRAASIWLRQKGKGRLQIELFLNLERREDGRRPQHVSNIELDPLRKAEPSVREGRFRSSPDAIRLVKCAVFVIGGSQNWSMCAGE
jgi:hypothetical protein